VNKLLPNLLLVAFQDGVYFVGDEKDHDNPWKHCLWIFLAQVTHGGPMEKYAWTIAEEKLYDESRFSNNSVSITTGDFCVEKQWRTRMRSWTM
jgi:hypothetical protein